MSEADEASLFYSAMDGVAQLTNRGEAPKPNPRLPELIDDNAEALAQLDEHYARWVAGVRSLDEGRLAQPVGEAEGPFAEHPYAELVLHINREALHHSAEVLLLRDLYRERG